MMIKQGDWPVEAYIADFKIIISRSDIMEDAALIWDFQKGLNPKLVKKIWAQTKLPETIDDWYKAAALQEGYWRRALAIWGLDKVTHEKKKEEKPTKDSGNGMSINRLSNEEWSEHIWKGLCFICHQPRHLSTVCPRRNKNYQYVSRLGRNVGGRDGLAKVHTIMAKLDEEEWEAIYAVIDNEGLLIGGLDQRQPPPF